MTDAATSPLLHRLDGGVCTLTLNRPGARNALSDELLAALEAGLARAVQDSAVRVIVLAANGPAFSAGHDLKEMVPHWADGDGGEAYFAGLLGACARVMQAIVRCPKPVIAQVQGIATAAGCQLVASCDLAIAGESARFATPGVKIGLFCSTPMVALSRNVARKHALEMLLTGDMISASRAAEMGLVNRVVPDAELGDAVTAMARHVASRSAVSIRIGKEAFYRQLELGLTDAYAFASGVMTRNMLEAEAREGIGAFLEKRPPRWE
ncbi:MAG: enoyl-CoA hydratase [Alphaproteobacteria bacterium]